MNLKLTHRSVQGHKAIFFNYEWFDDITCEFSLLCEVAESLITSFQRLLDERYPNGTEVVEVEDKPYMITVAK